MTKQELLDKKSELMSDYVRIQADLEKLIYVGSNGANTEKQLVKIEDEIAEINKKLEAFD